MIQQDDGGRQAVDDAGWKFGIFLPARYRCVQFAIAFCCT